MATYTHLMMAKKNSSPCAGTLKTYLGVEGGEAGGEGRGDRLEEMYGGQTGKRERGGRGER